MPAGRRLEEGHTPRNPGPLSKCWLLLVLISHVHNASSKSLGGHVSFRIHKDDGDTEHISVTPWQGLANTLTSLQ